MSDKEYMKIAIEEAEKGDFPFGAVIVKDDKIIAKSYNAVKSGDPTAHAEINVIRDACKILNSRHLSGCILYCTCEPCLMCFSAAWWAQITTIVYGVEGKDLPDDDWTMDIRCQELNLKSGNRIELKAGICKDDCLKVLRR
jgi:tRNA(adenine34) deaminase